MSKVITASRKQEPEGGNPLLYCRDGDQFIPSPCPVTQVSAKLMLFGCSRRMSSLSPAERRKGPGWLGGAGRVGRVLWGVTSEPAAGSAAACPECPQNWEHTCNAVTFAETESEW